MPIEITRRQTLQSLATAAAFATGAGSLLGLAGFGLIGCGGGGNGGGGGGTGTFRVQVTPVTARIALPPGSTAAAPAALKVWTAGGNATPKSDGAVSVRVFNGGPQFAEARDAQGRLVVAGFVGKDRTALDAASTAEFLAFLAIGGYVVTSKAREVVLAGVRGLAGFDRVTAAVAAGLVRAGHVEIADAELKAALDAFATPLLAGRGAGAHPVPSGRGTNVEPAASASGISLDIVTDDQVTLTNVFLRRAIGWLDPIEYEVETGPNKTERRLAPAPDLTKKPFKIDSPKRYAGFVGTIADALSPGGSKTYKPVVLDPMPIPASPPEFAGAVATKYELTIVGLGLNVGKFDEVFGDRQKAGQRLMVEAFLVDYVLPLVAAVIVPMKGDELDKFLDFANGNAVLTDCINTIFGLAPNLWRLCSEGKNAEAFRAITDSAPLYYAVLPLILSIYVNWLEEVGTDAVRDKLDVYVKDATAIMGLIGAFDRAISAGDLVIAGFDLRDSNRADVFMITSSGGKVTLAANKAEYGVSESAVVTATIQNKNPQAVYKYEWSVSAGYRANEASGKNTDDAPGGVLASNSESVAVIKKEATEGTGKVTCKVTRIDGEPDVVVGTGETTVKFGVPAIVGGQPEATIVWQTDSAGQYYAYLLWYVAIEKVEGATYYRSEVKAPEDDAWNGPFYLNPSFGSAANNNGLTGDTYGIRNLFEIPTTQIWVTRQVIRYRTYETSLGKARERLFSFYPEVPLMENFAKWRLSKPWSWKAEFAAR